MIGKKGKIERETAKNQKRWLGIKTRLGKKGGKRGNGFDRLIIQII